MAGEWRCLLFLSSAHAVWGHSSYQLWAPTTPPTPRSLSTSVIGSVTDLALAGGDGTSLQLSFRAAGADSVEITVRLASRTWLGLGISEGEEESMFGNGQGSDVVACTDGEVRRYWVTSTSVPLSDYTVVQDSSCTQANGDTNMTFVRRVAAENSRQRALTPGTRQQVIFAYGSDGGTSIQYHGNRIASRMVDFGTGASEEASARSGPAPLFLHLALMSAAWCGLLPFGVSVASRLRSAAGAPKGKWLRLHVSIQVIGWLVQLLGFGAAIWYCQAYAGHFNSTHSWLGLVVVVLCTLQPLNGVLRPHADEQKSRARVIWEIFHKGLGWLVVLLGVANVIIGILAASERGYDAAVLGTAGGLAALFALPVALFFLATTLRPEGAIARCVLGSSKADNQGP